MNNDFAGKDGFCWWTGVVEDRMDPLKLGRCRVRCVGWHSNNKMELPTKSLPWAMITTPTNNRTVYAPKEGERVFGFFADGEEAQHPIILGVFPMIPLNKPNSNTAFSDARTEEILKSAPRLPKSREYKTDGSGIALTEEESAKAYPDNLDEPTTQRMARNDTDYQDPLIQERKSNLVTVPTVSGKWTEPETNYNTVYPYSKVDMSESGHYFEMDDTPGSERVTLYHRAGSFIEYFPNGSVVEKVTKDNYTIIMSNDRVYIMGKCQVTVQGDAEVYVQGNGDVNVDGNVGVKIKGNFNMDIDGTCKVNSGGNMSFTAPKIDLN